jgi:hypothetical protein
VSFDDIKFSSDYSAEDINRITKDFVDMVKYLRNNETYYGSIVNECDKALGDLYHYCELYYPTTRSGKTKVVSLIRDISTTRRKAKDILELVEPILKLDTSYMNELGRVSNSINKTYSKLYINERRYTPRVLVDLFDEVGDD